jgi:hypothetical protein
MRRLTERAVTMTSYIRAKIKDRDQFKQVFPLPKGSTNTPDIAKFILSILGQTIKVQKRISPKGTFYYVSDIDSRFVIIPNWIEYFDTVELLPVDVDGYGQVVVLENGVAVISG